MNSEIHPDRAPCEICGEKSEVHVWDKLKERQSASMTLNPGGISTIETKREYRFCCKKHIDNLIDKMKKEAGYDKWEK